MSTHGKSWGFRPPKRFWHLFWFPFFFIVAFGLMFSINIGHPSPHDVQLGMIGSTQQVQEAKAAIAKVQPTGIDYHSVGSSAEASQLIHRNEIAGVLDVSATTPQFYVAMAAGGSRAFYLESMIDHALGTSVHLVNLVPTSAGDFTGVGLFFFSLPLQIMGLIVTAMLVISGVTRWRQKILWIAIYGAFGAGFSYLACTSMQLIPRDPWLLVLGFTLTQTISWIAIGGATFLKHFFMPVLMPFIVIFEIPISGGPMSVDMMPQFSQVLHAVLPFSRYLDAARRSAYFNGYGTFWPIFILLCWTAVAMLIVAAAIHRTHKLQRLSNEKNEAEEAGGDAHGGEAHESSIATTPIPEGGAGASTPA